MHILTAFKAGRLRSSSNFYVLLNLVIPQAWMEHFLVGLFFLASILVVRNLSSHDYFGDVLITSNLPSSEISVEATLSLNLIKLTFGRLIP
jgi:hypothetical protein